MMLGSQVKCFVVRILCLLVGGGWVEGEECSFKPCNLLFFFGGGGGTRGGGSVLSTVICFLLGSAPTYPCNLF